MKKLLLLLIATISISASSCSGDDDSAPVNQEPQTGGVVSFKVNGQQKTFNNIQVNVETDSDGHTDLTVTASQDGNPAESIIFGGYEGSVGSIGMTQWGYQANGVTFSQSAADINNIHLITAITEVNSNGVLKGTFTGSLTTTAGTQNAVEITDGTFDIIY